MDRRVQLWVGVSALALLGVVALPMPALAGMAGGNGQGNAQDNDLDPHGGFQHECGEPGGCADAGERFESRSADEFGEDEDGAPLVGPAQPRSGNSGLSGGDSVRGGIHDGGLGGSGGGLAD